MAQRLQEVGAGELDHASEELISVTERVAAFVPGFQLKRRKEYQSISFIYSTGAEEEAHRQTSVLRDVTGNVMTWIVSETFFFLTL